MHIEKFTVRQRPYLRLVESKRRLTRNGRPISGKRLVLSLGPLSRHDDGKFGVSKENRRQPIVQIGLFMDDNGIPISFGMFPGNTLDHHTLRPAMRQRGHWLKPHFSKNEVAKSGSRQVCFLKVTAFLGLRPECGIDIMSMSRESNIGGIPHEAKPGLVLFSRSDCRLRLPCRHRGCAGLDVVA